MNPVTAFLNVIVPGSEQPSGTVPDTIPDPFSFPSVTGALRSTWYTSDRIVLSGIPNPVPISIVGGTYSLNDGPYVVSPALAAAGDALSLQVQTAASATTATTATVTVGGSSVGFTVTTGA